MGVDGLEQRRTRRGTSSLVNFEFKPMNKRHVLFCPKPSCKIAKVRRDNIEIGLGSSFTLSPARKYIYETLGRQLFIHFQSTSNLQSKHPFLCQIKRISKASKEAFSSATHALCGLYADLANRRHLSQKGGYKKLARPALLDSTRLPTKQDEL